MIWEIGQDAFGSNLQYSLLHAIDEVVNEATVGISETNPIALRIFPNPVRQRLSIQVPEATDYRLTISDMQGKIVLEDSFAGNEMPELNVGDFPAGMYVVSVYGETGVRTGKFVKA